MVITAELKHNTIKYAIYSPIKIASFPLLLGMQPVFATGERREARIRISLSDRYMNRHDLVSQEERDLLRDSIHRLLERRWPQDRAADLSGSPEEIASVWEEIADAGMAQLGSDPQLGGLREILVVMEELGYHACPAPMIGAALANLAFGPAGEWPQAIVSLAPALHAGEARLAFAFASFDGDAGAGDVREHDGALEGFAAFIEGLDHATHVLIALEDRSLGLVEIGDPGLRVIPTPGYSEPPLARVDFDGVRVSRVALEHTTISDLNLLARLMLAARAFGAARRAFELVVEYAKTREQFGQPIGRFQAIQHKLADCRISIDGVELTLANAAGQYDRQAPEWRVFASACLAFASPALRQVSLETHHVFGAIGYAEEHEAPRHFRRVHADMARHGAVRRAQRELANYLLDQGHNLPEQDLGPEGNAFRLEVRDWLERFWKGQRQARYQSLPLELRHSDPEYNAEVGRMGWHAMSWPAGFGGQERTPFEQLAVMEEVQRAGAPRVARGEIQAHALMQFGTPEQQAEYLPRIRTGEISFCLGYSEAAAGSDLAALKTTAVRDGDDWVINGEKLWTTFGDSADYMWLAARTDPDASPPHAGISVFIVPMDAPGLSVRPSMALYGHTFCAEHLDNVRVPGNALVGKVNDGWRVLTSALATERIAMGAFVALICANFEKLLAELRRAPPAGPGLREDGAVRQRVATLAAEIEVARQLLTRCVELMEQGRVPIQEAAISKTFTGELMERIGEAALDLLGVGATLYEGAEGAVTNGSLEQMLRRSIMMVIGGGTAEIQRSLIARRGLGLPR